MAGPRKHFSAKSKGPEPRLAWWRKKEKIERAVKKKQNGRSGAVT